MSICGGVACGWLLGGAVAWASAGHVVVGEGLAGVWLRVVDVEDAGEDAHAWAGCGFGAGGVASWLPAEAVFGEADPCH